MTLPTTATVSIEIAAPATDVYALVADITNMGRWSPECHRCEWLDEPGRPGSRFRGHNKRGLARWSTTAEVEVAEPGIAFTFVTLHGDKHSTRWSYTFDDDGNRTILTESFESIYSPPLIALAERTVLRNRQGQLEDGLAKTLDAVKTAAEQPGGAPFRARP